MSNYIVGALPYKFVIRKPVVASPEGVPYRLMMDSDFASSNIGCNSFRDFMLQFIKTLSELKDYNEQKVGITIPLSEIDSSCENELRFVIKAGKYGYESELKNVDTSNIILRKTNDCELLPFACRMVFNPPHQYAIIIFEKFGNASCVGVFFKALQDYISKVFTDEKYRLDYTYITNKEHLTSVMSNVKAVHFVTRKKAHDLSDCLDYDEGSDQEVRVDVRISARRGGFLKLLGNIGNPLNGDFNGIRFNDELYEEMNLELKSGNRNQTVYSARDVFLVPFDVTNKVEISSTTGHPTKESFFAACQDCLNKSFTKVYGERS